MPKAITLILAAFGLVAGSWSFVEADEPSSALEFWRLGQVREQHKQFEEALTDYTKAIELDPRFVEAYFSRSSLYAGHPSIDKRDYAKAAADLTAILELVPRSFEARFNRALAYESLRKYDEAIADYTRVIEDDTDFSRNGDGRDKSLALTHHYRGRARQWYQRDHAGAVADFTTALRLEPEIEMVHYRRGQSHHALKDYASAQADFERALERDPDYPNLLCAYAWQLATSPDPRFRDGPKGVRLAEKANQKFNWKVADHVATLAAAHAESGAFAEAVKWQTKAIELAAPKAAMRREDHKALTERLKLFAAGQPYRVE
jgi:tetratricopeptide (TPR) repeat protein